MNIAKELKKLRAEYNLTLREMGEIAGCNHTYIWKLEKGKSKNPRIKMLSKIFGALNMDIILEDRG
jgi:transcriptional regulator with XRE-family HTH domain